MTRKFPPDAPVATIDYVNWRRQREKRRITPHRVHYGVTAYHTEPCWLLDAYCHERQAFRTFAIKDIKGWEE